MAEWDRAQEAVGSSVPVLGRTRTLDSHASRLRRKLTVAGAEDCVLNVWGVGYRLLAAAEPVRRTA